MMKVLYDHQVFSLQDFGGVSLVFSELLRAFKTMPNDVTAQVFAPLTSNINLQSVQKQLSWSLLHNISHPLKYKIQFHSNKLLTIPLLKQGDFDIFHPTYYNPYYLPHLKKPLVVTINDMAHEVFNTDPAFNAEVRGQKKLIAEKATRVITISNYVKADLMRIYNIPSEKIEVVYLGGDNILRPDNQDAGNFAAILPKKYILYDGTRKNTYKNFRPFLTAIAAILKKDLELHVVCAGGIPFSPEEKEFFISLGIEKQMVHVPIQGTMPMQAVFWKNATLFAYPSLYEGFGIPLVQSMYCGCPTVGSNTGSTSEIGGDAVFYFDGKNPEDIHSTVEKALYNEEARKEKVAIGLKRAQEFTWQKTAEKTLAVYQSLL